MEKIRDDYDAEIWIECERHKEDGTQNEIRGNSEEHKKTHTIDLTPIWKALERAIMGVGKK